MDHNARYLPDTSTLLWLMMSSHEWLSPLSPRFWEVQAVDARTLQLGCHAHSLPSALVKCMQEITQVGQGAIAPFELQQDQERSCLCESGVCIT